MLPITRILSDIHLGHPASLVGAPAELAPLMENVGTLIFNGDTVETRFRKDRPQGGRNLEALVQVCKAQGTKPVFLNGNHDPAISPLSHLDLGGGAVLVTHGDMLFHEISPWSNEARVTGEAHRRALEEMGEDAFEDFEKRLHASKCASLALELHASTLPRGPLARIVTFLREAWPPWRPWQIINCWRQTPDRAVDLARVFRPRTRFLIIGHTHYCGIWRRGPRVVINTGSFLPIAGRTLVDLAGDQLIIRKIAHRRGVFAVGPVVAEFAVAKIMPQEGF